MKTRSGFVSNSSSSSFVVAFKTVPQSVEELQAMLFDPNQETYLAEYHDCDFPASQVAETVWKDMQEPIVTTAWGGIEGSGPLTPKQIAREFSYGYTEGMPERNWRESPDPKKNKKAYDKWRDDYEAELEAWGKARASEFIAANKDCTFFTFKYSDNDGGYFCALEHGDLFHKLPHLRISHH